MPAKALVFALLLSCSSLAVTALSLMEEPLRDLPIRGPTPLTISNVNWKMETSTTLQLCAAEGIPDGQALLHFGDLEGGPQLTIYEDGDDTNQKCSTFQMSSTFRLAADPILYQLAVKDESGTGLVAAGSITLAMTVQTALLSCGDRDVTKLSWSTDYPITCKDPSMDTATNFVSDCYLAQSFANTDLCFFANAGTVEVCLNGPIDDNVISNDQLSVTRLAYGPPEVLSLSYAFHEMGNMRAIVRLAANPPGQPGQATVYDCPGGSCTMIAASAPGHETYEVCGEARAADDGHSLKTATAKIIDLNLFVFVGGTNVLEFVFVNGLESKMYTATLFGTASPGDSPLDTISVDCTEVEAENACFGFFSTATTGLTDPLYVALSDAIDDSNKIIATYTERPPEQAQVHRHGPQFNHSVRTKLPS